MTSKGHIQQANFPESAQLVNDATGKFIMLWAVDELLDQVVAVPRILNDIFGEVENFSEFEPTFLHYRAGLAD